MGRKSRKEIIFQDKYLEKLILNFCRNVRTVRISKNLTQQRLAEISRLGINTIGEIEQERIENLRLSTITTLGKALNITPLKLLKSRIHIKRDT